MGGKNFSILRAPIRVDPIRSRRVEKYRRELLYCVWCDVILEREVPVSSDEDYSCRATGKCMWCDEKP